MLQPKLCVAVIICAALAAQVPQAPDASKDASKPELTIRTGTQEVLLDLVVRDKHDKLVNDLKSDEISIRVDGVPQTVRGFRRVSGKEQVEYVKEQDQTAASAVTAGGNTGGAPKGQKVPEVNLVAIVFSNLNPNSRNFAREAATEFLKHDILTDTYVAVFSLNDNGLNALQGFTNSRERLLAAVNHAATGNYSQFAAESMNILNQIDTHVEITATGGPGGQVVTGSTVSSVDINQTADLSTAGAEGNFSLGSQLLGGILHQNLLAGNYAYGMRTLTALMTMTKEMARLPGRKTILYMSDGMVLPAENSDMLQTAIGLANRSNVSFYSIDTRGLMTASAGNAANASLRHGASVSRSQNNKNVVSPDQFKQDDSVLYAVKSANTQGPMATLAENTGGFLIANTNDLKPLMGRVMEDVVEHYELSFSPTPTNYDGRFRKIEVKLERKGVHAQSRNGFYDLPFIPGQTVLPYELLALQALTDSKSKNLFPFRVGAFRFRQGPAETQCSMAFEVPISILKTQASEDGKSTELHVAFVALVKDSTGQVITKVSQDIPYHVPNENFDRFRNGNVIVTEVFEVPAGVYSIESAVVDRIGQQASTKRSIFVVEPRGELGLSSIALARRVDPLKEERNPYDPMQYKGGKITPSLTDTVQRGEDASVYFQIYPNRASSDKPELTLDFFLDGQQVASETPELPKPDSDGTIPFVATAKLNPGVYTVRATVKQGRLVKEETSSIMVQ